MNLINYIITCSFYFILFPVIFLSLNVSAQETNSHATGRVFSDKNETLAGATITVIHEPTQSKYVSVTRNDGYFHFFNLKPGGPYSIDISSIGYTSLKKTNLYIHLTSEHFFLTIPNSRIFLFIKKLLHCRRLLLMLIMSTLTKVV